MTSELVLTGLSLGMLHVLAGPDHLSALATLSVGNSWKAMTLGIRWGLGHSTGLVVVAFIIIALKAEINLGKIGQVCNAVLGVFMVVIGSLGVIGAFRTYGVKVKKRDLDIDRLSTRESKDTQESVSLLPPTAAIRSASYRKSSDAHSDRSGDSSDTESLHPQNDCLTDHVHSDDSHNLQNSASRIFSSVDMHDSATQRILSFVIGVLHGVAGPGAILGVLPAVEMQSWRASTCYLLSFVFASTLSMGAFAALYGELTKRLGSTAQSVELALRVFSSSLSVLVGLVWLVLSVLGKLDRLIH